MSKTIHELISSQYYRERVGYMLAPNHPALGIEIEVEHGMDVEAPLKWWCIEGDGSLRDNGREFISNVPVPFKDKQLPILEYLNTIAPDADEYWKHNYRTSIHVHINVAPLNREQFSRILKLYMLVEGTFFRMGGEWRRTSPYCVPLNDAPLLFSRVLKLANSKWNSAREYRHEMSWTSDVDCKYCAFGLFRLGDLCTVELRMHEGTNDHARLMTMLDACTDLYDMAAGVMPLIDAANVFAERYDYEPDIPTARKEHSVVSLWMGLSTGRSTTSDRQPRAVQPAPTPPDSIDIDRMREIQVRLGQRNRWPSETIYHQEPITMQEPIGWDADNLFDGE